MKIIIDIPDEMFETIKEFDGKHDVLIDRKSLYSAIKNGRSADDYEDDE